MLSNRRELRGYLLTSIEGLGHACVQKAVFNAAFLLRDWAASISNMVSAGTALPIKAGKEIELINNLLAFRGGVACSGAAHVFTEALRACGIPAAEYYYGFHLLGDYSFSHLTTVFVSGKKPYMMDAYLRYHFEDLEGSLLPLCQMLRMIRRKEYSQIRRVDRVATRARVCRAGDKCYGAYVGGRAPLGERHGDLMVYHGCQMSMTNFLLTGARVKMFKDVYGDRPIDEVLLDCLFANAKVGPGLGRPGRELSDILTEGRVTCSDLEAMI